jgi:dTDP-4-dehydrorhamnose reductase
MLGHQLLLSLRPRHDVRVTLRQPLADDSEFDLFTPDNAFDAIDVRDFDRVRNLLETWRPQAVVNAVGLIKQRPESKDAALCEAINVDFPHRLRAACEAAAIRLVHISTDCVFDGARGRYLETDTPNATDAYGKSKARGEIRTAPGVTLRTSLVGLELKHKHGLVEWFLARQGTISGFTRAIFSGLTTLELSRVIERVLVDHPGLTGVRQVASEPISKFELLNLLSAKLGRSDLRIEPDATFVCDRSLNGEAFARITGYRAPSWDRMLDELARQIRRRGPTFVEA